MFTGIVEEMGGISEIGQRQEAVRLTVFAKKVLERMKIGDSIAIDGICLTVTTITDAGFSVDLSPETMRMTTMGVAKVGDPVNLERAMRLSDRISGHLVSGHIEGIGVIGKRSDGENALALAVDLPLNILQCCIPKGSIAIDGVSLTINELTDWGIVVSIIPHTASVTTLGKKEVGSLVNLESDLIGRYVERLLTRD